MKIKKVGAKEFSSGKINIPDSCKEYLERYKLEIIEISPNKALCLHFVKDEVDFYSHTIYNYADEYNLREGFKYAVEKLKCLESLIDDNKSTD